jgi:hypothetical protein
VGALGAGYASIADATFSTNRSDTIVHEIGHNLGLGH